ncbi:MAG: helix-turn-helix domain-containing protein [Halomonas sp.]
MDKLCKLFNCKVGDLLELEDDQGYRRSTK